MPDPSRMRRPIGVAAGALLIFSAFAHGVIGWPAMAEALDDEAVAYELVGALAVGWLFGTMAMVVFGLIVLQIALRDGDPCPVRFVALGYLVFGLAAWLARDLEPHFLIFVATGVLLALFGFSRSR